VVFICNYKYIHKNEATKSILYRLANHAYALLNVLKGNATRNTTLIYKKANQKGVKIAYIPYIHPYAVTHSHTRTNTHK